MEALKKGLRVAVVVVLSGCTFQKPLPTMSYGPVPPNYQTQIVTYFQNILKDPDSAKYQFDVPRRAYGNTGLAYGGGISWIGYAVRIQINAKNSYGGYTGFKPYTVFFTNGAASGHEAGLTPTLVTFVD